MAGAAFERQVQALDDGRAVLDLEGWTLTEVRGADAQGWLNDLVTASMEGIRDGEAVRSLLLSPTGRIRADFHVLRSPGRGSCSCRDRVSRRRSPPFSPRTSCPPTWSSQRQTPPVCS